MRKELDNQLKDLYERMENKGFRIDQKGVRSYLSDVKANLEGITQEICRISGKSKLNPNSNTDMVPVLQGLGYRLKRTKTGFSLAKDAVEELKKQKPSELLDLFLDFKDVHFQWKQANAFVKKMDSGAVGFQKSGRLNFKFSFDEETHRVFTKDYCVSNINKNLRYYLLPEPDSKFVVLDYSAQEFMMFLAFAGETEIVKRYEEDPNFDVYKHIASKVFGMPEDQVTKEFRAKIKVMSLGLSYLQEAYGLSKTLDCSKEEAQNLMDKFFDALPKVKSYIDLTLEKIKSTGASEDIFGHVYKLDRSQEDQDKELRRAFNKHVQNPASVVTRMALYELWTGLFGINFHVTVYDSVVASAHVEKIENSEFINSLLEKMKIELKDKSGNHLITLHAKAKIGMNWGEVT